VLDFGCIGVALRATSHYGHPNLEAMGLIEWPNFVESSKKWAINRQ